MIEKERITAKLLFMETNLNRLDQLASLGRDDFLSDFRNAESAKHLLQVTIECMIDICEHITAKKRFGIPDNSAEAIRMVYRSGFVPTGQMDTYVALTRFRNRIVHLYHDVDDMEIYRITKEHRSDIRTFIREIITGFGI